MCMCVYIYIYIYICISKHGLRRSKNKNLQTDPNHVQSLLSDF